MLLGAVGGLKLSVLCCCSEGPYTCDILDSVWAACMQRFNMTHGVEVKVVYALEVHHSGSEMQVLFYTHYIHLM